MGYEALSLKWLVDSDAPQWKECPSSAGAARSTGLFQVAMEKA